MQEALTPTLEQVMKDTAPPSVRVHDLSLARHIDHSSDSDIANDARTSHLPSSSDADRAALQHVDHIRPKHGCYRLPPLRIVL
jgi:LmbE family N-acetylglucosaminyl deacetylase